MSFLFTMLRNATTDAQRSAQRLGRNELIPDVTELDHGNHAYGLPESSTMQTSTNETIRGALATIPSTLRGHNRTAFSLLREDPEMSNEELAARLRVTPGNARTIRKRALDKALMGLKAYAEDQEDFELDIPETADRKSNNRGPKSVKTKASQLQSELAAWAEEQVASGVREAALYVPSYIGAWTVAAQSMQRHVKHAAKAGDEPGIGAFVAPHEALLPSLRTLLRGVLGKNGSFIVDTLANVAARFDKGERIGYAIIPNGVAEADDELRAQLLARSDFLLRLLDRSMSASTATATHIAPSYKTVGPKNIVWKPEDSVRYLREWRLAHGEQLTEEAAIADAKAGTGPSLKRLLMNVGSFASLMANAGYSFETPDSRENAPRLTASVA